MKLEKMIYEKKEMLSIITIDNAERMNALTKDVLESFDIVFREIQEDDNVRVAILTGIGNKAFCSGADITTFGELTRKMMQTSMSLFEKIERLSKPLIAAVNGVAYGAGFEITLACDLVVASKEARFGLPEAKVGVAPFFGMIRLHQEVGRHRAKEIMMTRDSLTAMEAYHMGLVNRVVEAEKVMESAVEMAETIISKAPLSIQLIKSAINKDTGGRDLTYALEAASYLTLTEDVKEGMDSFFQKRKPVFKGR